MHFESSSISDKWFFVAGIPSVTSRRRSPEMNQVTDVHSVPSQRDSATARCSLCPGARTPVQQPSGPSSPDTDSKIQSHISPIISPRHLTLYETVLIHPEGGEPPSTFLEAQRNEEVPTAAPGTPLSSSFDRPMGKQSSPRSRALIFNRGKEVSLRFFLPSGMGGL